MIFDDIKKERDRQAALWGDQLCKDRYYMLAVLTEELGEVAKALMDDGPGSIEYRRELIQLAAVAVQMVEHFDKGAKYE